MTTDPPMHEGDPVHPLPITPELDLHTFRPSDVGDVVEAYLDEARCRGILEVRIVHGKGRGQLLRSVHALLARRADVISFSLATPLFGGPGATFVRLNPPDPSSNQHP
jgi:dsDNA-specific endonuclease/ATPase MutS2